MEKSGIVVVTKDGSSYRKIMSYLDEKARKEVHRVDSIGEALDVAYAEKARFIITDLGGKPRKAAGTGMHPRYNPEIDARENLAYLRWYINKHCGEKLDLADLAAMISVTPNYLCRIFKAEEGMTLRRYIESVRLGKAARELVMTDRRIQEIGIMFGFRSDSYFGKVFRQEFGFTPSQYRKIMREETMEAEEPAKP